MKGIILTAPNKLRLATSLPEPHPGPGAVKIRMLSGGVCGTDLSVIRGQRNIPSYPWVIGHEGGGEVVAVASDSPGLAVGDCVIIEPNIACMHCSWCLRGQTKMCSDRKILGVNTPGLFAEYVVIPADFAWKVPRSTAKPVLASLEPSVVAHVAVQRYQHEDHKSALVIGAGSQGLIIVSILAKAGLPCAVVDTNHSHLSVALEHGAHDMGSEPEARYDLVFETSGAAAGLQTAIDKAAPLGTICVIGQTNKPTEIISEIIVQKELRINGQLIYNHPGDFAAAIEALAAGSLDPTVALRDAISPSQAITEILSNHAGGGKVWIDFENW